MDEKPILKYFTGGEADQFTFYRIPKQLFTNRYFRNLSTDAKVLYGLMLDRISLSVKNHWIDEQNRVYIYFSVEDTMEYLNCRKIMLVPGLPTEDREELFKLIVQNYSKIVSLASQKGITCVCEDDPNIKIPCGSRKEVEAVLDAVPGLYLVYDSANMLPSGDEVIPYYEYFADRTAHIHLKDMAVTDTPEQFANPGVDHRFYLNAPHGTGIVDFDALFEALHKHGYNDTLAIEFVPMPGMDLEEDMKRVYEMFAGRV